MAITKIQSESLNLADTYAFTGTVTGAGGVNTPTELARASTVTTYATNANVKTTLDNEFIDTDNLFSDSRFTVTSGYEGKYLVNWRISFNFSSTTQFAQSLIYKNGSSQGTISIISGVTYGIFASDYNNKVAELNTGNPPFSISSGNTDGNGYGNFEYAPPSGYFALCTKNLAEYG